MVRIRYSRDVMAWAMLALRVAYSGARLLAGLVLMRPLLIRAAFQELKGTIQGLLRPESPRGFAVRERQEEEKSEKSAIGDS
jgi:hypothetical protein